MAIKYATKTGNWSDSTVWNGGTLPTSADDVYSNTFTVTIDTSPTVLSISNAATTGVTAGGTFVSSNGITVTCTGAGVVAGSVLNSAVITSSPTAIQSWTLVSNCTGGNTNGAVRGVVHTGAGTLYVTGNCTGGSANNGAAIQVQAGTVNITGNCTGGTGGTGNGGGPSGVEVNGGTVNVTGTLLGGGSANANGVRLNFGTPVVIITGSVTAGTAAGGMENISSGQVTVTGSIFAGTSYPAIAAGGVSQITILTGPLISTDGSGGTAAASGVNPCVAWRWFPADTALSTFEYRMRGATISGSPSVRPARQLFLADAYAAGYPTAGNVRSGTTYGPGSIYTGTCAVPGASSVLSGVPVDNTTGTVTITAADIRSALGLSAANLDTQLSNLSSGQTTINDNVSTRLASSAYTAPLDATGTRTALGLSSANLDTQFSNIPGNVRTNLSTELGRIDTTVSSRLAAASYQTPLDAAGTRNAIGLASANLDSQLDALPTASENASAVRTELSPELGRIDTTISSRLASASYQAPLDASGTRAAIGLASASLDTQLDALPTAVENANAVRTELTPELNHIDVNVSSRLASVDYTIPPTSLQNAEAVRTELTTELGRIDVASSTRLAAADYTTPPTSTQNAEAVRTELSSELGRIDVATSTRSTFNPASDIVANVTLVDTTTNLTNPPDVPTTTEIATAVRTELSPELSNMDAAVSTRSTFNPTSDTVAHVTLVDTTTDLTNPPVVPTPVQIAEQVRTELTPELDRIDADVSSRLAAANYEQPPTPEQNAEAVRVELTPELERVANCATVATTGEQIQDAWARTPAN